MRSQDHCEAENLFHRNRPLLNQLKRGGEKKEPRETIRKKNWTSEWSNCWCLSSGTDVLTKDVSFSLMFLQGKDGKRALFVYSFVLRVPLAPKSHCKYSSKAQVCPTGMQELHAPLTAYGQIQTSMWNCLFHSTIYLVGLGKRSIIPVTSPWDGLKAR